MSRMVEFAVPFSTPPSGVRVTDSAKGSGVCVTFSVTKNPTSPLSRANLRKFLRYAKVVLFKVLLKQTPRATARLLEKESSTILSRPTDRSAAVDLYSGERTPNHPSPLVGRGKKTRALTTFHIGRRLLLGGSSAVPVFDPPSDRRAIAAGGDRKRHARRSEIDPLHGLGKPKRGATLRGANVTAAAATAGVSTHWRDRRGSTPAVATAYRRPATLPAPLRPAPDRPQSGQHPGQKPRIFLDNRHHRFARPRPGVRAPGGATRRAGKFGCPGLPRRVILQALTRVTNQQRSINKEPIGDRHGRFEFGDGRSLAAGQSVAC